MASVRADRKARARASIVAYSRFGIYEIVLWVERSCSAVVTSACFTGRRACSKVRFSVVGRGTGESGMARDLCRDWVWVAVMKERDWRMCFGLEVWERVVRSVVCFS
jgi:hypothetical protein